MNQIEEVVKIESSLLDEVDNRLYEGSCWSRPVVKGKREPSYSLTEFSEYIGVPETTIRDYMKQTKEPPATFNLGKRTHTSLYGLNSLLIWWETYKDYKIKAYTTNSLGVRGLHMTARNMIRAVIVCKGDRYSADFSTKIHGEDVALVMATVWLQSKRKELGIIK